MFTGDYKWQHDYVRLAFDTGFKFEKHKCDELDKNRLSLVDIDRLIEERDIASVEKLIPWVTKFVLDPDQTQVLDVGFVKTFHLSQLVIQYLLFCKKYLDNTLVTLKKELKKAAEENKELNLFVDDLKEHISRLMKEIDEKSGFKCDQCNKVFSTEEFLNSHIKRRHTFQPEVETDKLQMEIKELKGRLNNAEKMIQKEHNEIDSNITKETDAKKVEELQQKFEELRLQVQSELKVLQAQHNYQEKYEKLFEKMTFQGVSNLGYMRESTTQTDVDVQLDEAASNRVVIYEEKDKENVPELSNANHQQISKFGEALETKMTSSLEKIEKQMRSFWDKLNEMEMYRSSDIDGQPRPIIKPRRKSIMKISTDEDENSSYKNQVSLKHDAKDKKRDVTDASQEIKSTDDKNDDLTYASLERATFKNKKPLKHTAVKAMKAQPQTSAPKQKADKIESGIYMPHLSDDTTSDTVASEEITSEEEPVKPPTKVQSFTVATREAAKEEIIPRKPQPLPRKRSATSVSTYVVDDELLQHFRLEIENTIMARLQDLGVSPDWKGLPNRSFQRVLEIVNHQTSLTKKNYPNFDFISTQIEKAVTKKVNDAKNIQKKFIRARAKKVEAKKTKISSVGKVPSPRIEIKNRKMYDTDSESEVKSSKVQENLRQFSVPYSAVIEELKTVTTKIDGSDKSDNSIKEEKMVKEDQTKGVLKNYPSVGSLTKKKVLFNLEENKKELSPRDGGSTTSITSSVFDGTPRNEDLKKKEKDIESLSDFDFSDM